MANTHWRFRIARQANMAQYEAETGGLWRMSVYMLDLQAVARAKPALY
jgi:hypothetical protein